MRLRRVVSYTLLLALGACATEPRRIDRGAGDVGILGSLGSQLASGRPAIESSQSIARRSGGADRTAVIETGTAGAPDTGARRPVEIGDGGKTITLNFVDTELQAFVRVVFDEILKETVVVDPALKGRITLRSAGPVSRTAALDLVRQALQGGGAALLQSGGVYRVVVKSDQRASRQLGETIRIVPLRFVGAEEARAALAPFVQAGVEVTSAPGGSYLTIAGAPAEIENLEQVLATLDVDQMKGMSVALLPLREAGAANVANELMQLFGKSSGGDQRGFRAMPITRMNAVLIVTPRAHLLARARKWVANLDRADQDGRRIYVYPVQNRRAPEVARILATMWDKGRERPPDAANRTVSPQLTPTTSLSRSTVRNNEPPQMPEIEVPELAPQNGTEQKSQSPRINADAATNSIVAIATPDEWRVLEAALRRLDISAPQVLIEATIAEVRLNDSLRHGVRWYFQNGPHNLALTDSTNGALGSVAAGFNYVFSIPAGRIALNALEQITDVEIVSSPALTVLDNQTAKLQVGDQVPVATRSARSVISPDAPIVNDIEFKDTGVILSVTPRVNASGLVLLDITQEVSDVVPTTTSNLNSPTIRQRRINSTVSVHSGAEIVLGGLIGVGRSRTREGLPLLGDIPLIGEVFKSQSTREGGRTELLVILRPTVMGNRLDVDHVTSEIKSRMHGSSGAIYR
jgi:general secretion pathway protein D